MVPGLSDVIFEHGQIINIEKEQILVEKGTILSGLFIPIDNDLILIDKKNRMFLNKGRSLGLKNLLFKMPIEYEVRAESNTKVIFLERNLFIQNLEQHPRIKSYLEVFTTSEAVRSFKRFLYQFNLSENDLNSLVAEIKSIEFMDLDDLRLKLKDHIVFINKGELFLSFLNRSNSSDYILKEGTWAGVEAINPPFELSYIYSSYKDLELYVLDLKLIRGLNLSFEILEKIEDEPWLKLNFYENDQYLNDVFKGNSIGEKVNPKEMLKVSTALGFNLSDFSVAKSLYQSFQASLKNFTSLLDIDFSTASCESTLKRDLPYLSLNTFLDILHEHDLVARGKKIDPQEPWITFPLLLICQNRTFVLYFEHDQYVYGHDPIYEHFKIKKDELFKLEESEFIEARAFVKKDELEKERNKYYSKGESSSSWNQAKALLYERRILWSKILIVSILVFLINILPPFISQEIIDEVIDLKDLNSLYSYGIGLILCYFCIASLSYYRGKLGSEFSYLFDYDFSVLFYEKLLKLKTSFFGDNRIGEVFARFGELSRIRNFFSGATINTAINLVTAVIYSIILLFYSWKIAIIPFVAIVLIGIIQFFIKKYLREKYLKHFFIEKRTQSKLSEMINSISTIKAFISERAILSQYEENFLESVRLRRDIELINSLMNMIVSLFSQVVRISAIWVGVILIFKKELSIGELFSINMFISRVLAPLTSLVEFVTDLEEMKVSLKKLDDVFGSDSFNEFLINTIGATIKGRIHLDRISFRYNSDSPEILKDIELTIFHKQVIAIVGTSGCGKTTLANIIAGNLSPTKGKIYFDGMDQKLISHRSFKSQVGLIQQMNDLFAGTIESNVTYAHTYINDIHLEHALETSHSNEFIDRFPTGLNQYLAEGGMGLSGGQKQRLCIARTLYNSPKILILDEATSALDSESEAVLIDNIKKLSQGKTTIIIGHRLSTIRHADQIFVMDEGKIVEKGNHTELVEKRGKYYDLFKEQMR